MEARGALFEDGAKASIDAARKEHRAIWRIMIKMYGWLTLCSGGGVCT